MLLTCIGTPHNMSRSLGCALLAAGSNSNLVFIFVGGEMGLFFVYKIAMGDMYYFFNLDGWAAIVQAAFSRVVDKTITDFSGYATRSNLVAWPSR